MKGIVICYFLIANIIGQCNQSLNNSNKNVSKNNTDTILNNNHFTLLNAESENWTAGIESGGSGIEYYFKIIINVNNILFDTAWINNNAFRIYVTKKQRFISNQPITYTVGDTITLRISDLKLPNKTAKVSSIPPIQNNGIALISYYVNENRFFYSIKQINKRQTVNRP